ncbi:MAG TPA: type III pantothenate kinase [Candidatus Tectomicrobia bacterium]
MLLVIDVGNTNTVMGVYDGDRLITNWRLATSSNRTGDEYGILVQGLCAQRQVEVKAIHHVAISCVVPAQLFPLGEVSRMYFDCQPLIVDHTTVDIPILTDHPEEVGADRLVNAIAAHEKFHRDAIVVDFGTATTFDAVTADGAYLGGAISPGINISIEALAQQASKLLRVECASPGTVIGKHTVHAMQAGIYFGYAGLVDAIVTRMRTEMGGNPLVIATGGLASVIAQASTTLQKIEPYLTLEGLKIIFDKHRTKRQHIF